MQRQKYSTLSAIILTLVLAVAACAVDQPYVNSRSSSGSGGSDTGSGEGGSTGEDNNNRELCPELNDTESASYQGSGFHFDTICETDTPREPSAQDCPIIFQNLELQMQISSGGIVVIDSPANPAEFRPIPDIPILLSNGGKSLRLFSEDFPRVTPYLGERPLAVLEIYAKPNSEAQGSFDSETGELEINGVNLLADVFAFNSNQPDGKGTALGTITQMPPASFSTKENQKASGNSNPSEIIVSGSPYDPATRELTVVTALTIPEVTGASSLVDDSIGGGALAAVIKGELSQDPSTCETE